MLFWRGEAEGKSPCGIRVSVPRHAISHQYCNAHWFSAGRVHQRAMDQQVSAVDVCPVCKAKEQGRTPQRRKCTCNSGKTVTRAREPVSFNRNQERQSRELHYCCEGLVDHEDQYSKCEAAACLGAECDCKAWRRFESKLYNACRLPGHAMRNVSAARDLLTAGALHSPSGSGTQPRWTRINATGS